MKYFNKEKEFVPKYTVGGAFDGDQPPDSDKEKRMRQIESSIKMNKSKLGQLFSPFSQEQLKSPDIIKPGTDDEQTN